MITRAHDREQPYVETLLKEFELYLAAVPEMAKRPLRQLHLGGGTPTFLCRRQPRPSHRRDVEPGDGRPQRLRRLVRGRPAPHLARTARDAL